MISDMLAQLCVCRHRRELVMQKSGSSLAARTQVNFVLLEGECRALN
jgi:hypothetical protein